MLIALAWRNLWRRPQRTILSLLSIALVSGLLIFMLSFQAGVYSTMKEAMLRVFDGYAQFQPAGWADDPTLERAITDPADLARAAERIKGVDTAAPRLNSFAILANGSRSYGAAVVGVEPEREAKISSIAGAISSGRYLSAADSDSAVLGDLLARNLGVAVGGNITLLGSASDGSVAADVLHVVGIYHSGIPDLDRTILEMPISRAQDAFAMNGLASTIALGGKSLAAINRALPDLRALVGRSDVDTRDWAALEPALSQSIDLKYAIAMMFYATLVVVAAFINLNTLMMSVLERTREYGVQMALGMRPAQIGAVIWIELIGLAVMGCLIGISVGGGITLWLQHQGIAYPIDPRVLAQFGIPSRLYPALTPFSALFGPCALLSSIAAGGVGPCIHIMRLNPSMALRAP
jgi:ABC-type lipoprotein release transport system permease subunit